MSDLSDAYDRAGRRRSAARSVLLLAGSLVAAVGFAVTATSLIVGLGVEQAVALKVAIVLAGAVPLAVFLAPRTARPGGSRSLALAGAGAVAGLAGLALFWTSLSAGWSGDLARLSPVSVGAYAAGLLAAFGARLTAKADDRRSSRSNSPASGRNGDALGGVRTATRADDDAGRTTHSTTDSPGGGGTATPAVGDGGEDDDSDIEFFDE